MDTISPERYARCIRASKQVRWDIERDVIRGRSFYAADKFLPDGLTLADEFTTLSAAERRFVSQIQGRTYANIFGLVERFINAKVLQLSGDYALGDQVALEALVGFSQEEMKHQALFRRVEAMVGEVLPPGYRFDFVPDSVARAVLGKSTWAVLVLTLDIELFTQLHYRQSIDTDPRLSDLFRDVFLHHWKEESQHAILDELELLRHDAVLTPEQRDQGVDDLIELVASIDAILCGAVLRRRGLLRGSLRTAGRRRRGSQDPGCVPARLSLAIHPFRRPASAFREGADQPDHRGAGAAHPGGFGHAALGPRTTSTPANQRSIIMDGSTNTVAPTV